MRERGLKNVCAVGLRGVNGRALLGPGNIHCHCPHCAIRSPNSIKCPIFRTSVNRIVLGGTVVPLLSGGWCVLKVRCPFGVERGKFKIEKSRAHTEQREAGVPEGLFTSGDMMSNRGARLRTWTHPPASSPGPQKKHPLPPGPMMSRGGRDF